MGPTSSKKLRLENLERRRRTARDWWLYRNALENLKAEAVPTPADPLEGYELALIANGLRWSLIAIARDPATSSDPMLVASLPEIGEESGEPGIEARYLMTLAIAQLRNYRRGQS